MFWVGFGYFEAVGFQKKKFSALVGFGVVLGGYGFFN